MSTNDKGREVSGRKKIHSLIVLALLLLLHANLLVLLALLIWLKAYILIAGIGSHIAHTPALPGTAACIHMPEQAMQTLLER